MRGDRSGVEIQRLLCVDGFAAPAELVVTAEPEQRLAIALSRGAIVPIGRLVEIFSAGRKTHLIIGGEIDLGVGIIALRRLFE